ncbi:MULTISPECIES: hypothetical protein [Liquorilactobacillus]|nr:MULTISPECIES: hypothetical protein [Liquorilactobacillus]
MDKREKGLIFTRIDDIEAVLREGQNVLSTSEVINVLRSLKNDINTI